MPKKDPGGRGSWRSEQQMHSRVSVRSLWRVQRSGMRGLVLDIFGLALPAMDLSAQTAEPENLVASSWEVIMHETWN